jgi:hypothetical protein
MISMSTAALAAIAALIGAGGSVLGGLVGGWYALRAGHKQRERDRRDTRLDRSRQAAMSIADALGMMTGTLATWNNTPQKLAELGTANNMFSLTVTVQSIALIDGELRDRIHRTKNLVCFTSETAQRYGSAIQLLIEKTQLNSDAVLTALAAHIHGRPLPPYNPPPERNAHALADWSPDDVARPEPAVLRRGRQRKSKIPVSAR